MFDAASEDVGQGRAPVYRAPSSSLSSFDLSGSGPARFVALFAPSDEEIDRILRRIIRRAATVVAACDANPEDREDALAELQATEVDRGQRLAIALPHQRHSAMLDGFSLHAGVHIHASDHEGREKLLRYILRPPLALHRLSMGAEDEVRAAFHRFVAAQNAHDLREASKTLRDAPELLCVTRFSPLCEVCFMGRGEVTEHAMPAQDRGCFAYPCPRLPWYLYRWTQARVHGWVMSAFRRHLARLLADGASVPAAATG